MAESSIGIQPTPAAPAQPAPLQLRLFFAPDSGAAPGTAPGMVALQGVSLVDDQGRAFVPMTEATGLKIARLLDRLCRLQADVTGSIYTPDDLVAGT